MVGERTAAAHLLGHSCSNLFRIGDALKKRWLTASTAVLLAMILTAMIALPAQANYFIGQKNRTIYSRNLIYSQVWHIQFWQRTPFSSDHCDIFGRSLMDSFNHDTHPPIDYLDSVRIWDLTRGVEAVPGAKDSGFPPIAIQTAGALRLGVDVTHNFRVRGTARVSWSNEPIGPTGLHEWDHLIRCNRVTTSSGEDQAVIQLVS